MASAVSRSRIERLRSEPLRGVALAAVIAIAWLAGALYCSGYERLASGLDNWPASLWWSAAAVLPWLALFEWSKAPPGRAATATPQRLAAALVAVAAVSLALEYGVNALLGDATAPLALSLMRRLPAAGFAVLLILWSRGGWRLRDAPADDHLATIAPSIDWVGAADNYVELHIGGRTLTRRMTMREAERALAPLGFVRIHRRFLVNRARIASVASAERSQSVRLADGGELPVGRAFAPNLRQN